MYRIRRNEPGYGVINYMANTNGFTMMDMVTYDRKHNEANGEDGRDGTDYNYSWNCGVEGPSRKKKIVDMRKQQIRNAMLFLFLSQGTPLLLAGDEYGNSKSGNNNSYCQDNEISWINWNQTKTNEDILDFTRHAIAFRKAHPMLCGKQALRAADYKACGYPDISYHGVKAWYPEFENFRRQLGILYCGSYAKREDGSQDDFIFVLYNMHWDRHTFGLPNLPKNFRWHVAADTAKADVNGFYETGAEPILEDQKVYLVEGRSIAVLLGKAVPGLCEEPEMPQKAEKTQKSEKAEKAEKSRKAENLRGQRNQKKSEVKETENHGQV